jgi:hypothetical protein
MSGRLARVRNAPIADVLLHSSETTLCATYGSRARTSLHYAVTRLQWSFGQPSSPQSFLISREVFGMPIRANHVFEIGNA